MLRDSYLLDPGKTSSGMSGEARQQLLSLLSPSLPDVPQQDCNAGGLEKGIGINHSRDSFREQHLLYCNMSHYLHSGSLLSEIGQHITFDGP